MKGVFFLPTLNTLKHWLQKARFLDFEVIFSEELSIDEQRKTEWAPVRSLKESLNPNDPTRTVEGSTPTVCTAGAYPVVASAALRSFACVAVAGAGGAGEERRYLPPSYVISLRVMDQS